MNHTPEATGAAPRHRAEQERPTREETGAAFAKHIAEWAPSSEDARRILDTFATHGTAFAIYLALDGINQFSEHVEAEFKNTYLGFYWDKRSLIEDTIANFDWGTDLDRLLAGEPLLRAMVTFDHDEIWGFIADRYEIVDLDGGLYVYEPEP